MMAMVVLNLILILGNLAQFLTIDLTLRAYYYMKEDFMELDFLKEKPGLGHLNKNKFGSLKLIKDK